ncbi:maltose excess protein 1-like, chloroplastic isoform X2 [Selaginella moellendorffii]|uniref:maltose excess protein 1-like, chloroplastic isoform X2 n=1 Tax=Selaginella moellendorffii TaxID=88036 RepID=UPI000D1C7694|nr:maltose excess protein 1-like, chloroplastic isoform X2 [Selaginella moellendorffii]|eukprot:XP_024519556.1 maltose excess protein 1-like, chloroplastic isoform X2 [Selaginella moellendorffii]
MPRCRLWCRLKWWFCCCCCCCTDSGDTFPAQKMNANSILVIVSQTRRLLTNFLSFFQLFAFSTEARLSMQVVPRSFLMASSSNSNSYRELEDGDDGEEDDRQSLLLLSWNSTTIHLAEFATLPFLFLQLPQIILNARNLIAGNYEALSAVQWMGQLTSLLGNLSLLSYFAGRRERGAMAVQAVGVLTTLVVLIQLGIAGAMPSLALAGTVIAVAFGLLLNLLNYLLLLREWLWKIWEAVISVGGATVLLQVMWSTFEPHIPHTILPAVITGIATLTLVAMDAIGFLPQKWSDFLVALSAWTATLLFMWTPVAQMFQNFIDPENIKGLSPLTILLAMIGNGLLVPRALFTRDLMWFTGAAWGTLFQGWGLLLTLWIARALSGTVFGTVTGLLTTWLGYVMQKDSTAYALKCSLCPLLELCLGKRMPI